jgi:chorismate synthase
MLRFLTAGESHGPALAVIVEGMPAGVPVPAAAIDRDLARRQTGYGRGARSTKVERDHVEILGGLVDDRTTGAPIALKITNADFANQPREPRPLTAPRPGHADLAGHLKYGLEDFRLVRERASARETAARVAAGAVAKQLLSSFGTRVGSFVLSVGGVVAEIAPLQHLDPSELVRLGEVAEEDPVRCPDGRASERMREAIDHAKSGGETVGGEVVVFAVGVPPGLGSYVHWDRKLDGRLAQAVCSIHAIKGVEVGPAFELSRLLGSEAQDGIFSEGSGVVRRTNRSGGLEGGVTTGQPVVLRAAMKPLSSVRAAVASVDIRSGEPTDPPYVRSDICSVPAAGVVAEAMVAWVLADAVCERFGQDRLDLMLASRSAVADPPLPAPSPRSSDEAGG